MPGNINAKGTRHSRQCEEVKKIKYHLVRNRFTNKQPSDFRQGEFCFLKFLWTDHQPEALHFLRGWVLATKLVIAETRQKHVWGLNEKTVCWTKYICSQWIVDGRLLIWVGKNPSPLLDKRFFWSRQLDFHRILACTGKNVNTRALAHAQCNIKGLTMNEKHRHACLFY